VRLRQHVDLADRQFELEGGCLKELK
jgi:hypothetical protein